MCVYVCVCVYARTFRLVFTDKILRLINTLISINVDIYVQVSMLQSAVEVWVHDVAVVEALLRLFAGGTVVTAQGSVSDRIHPTIALHTEIETFWSIAREFITCNVLSTKSAP